MSVRSDVYAAGASILQLIHPNILATRDMLEIYAGYPLGNSLESLEKRVKDNRPLGRYDLKPFIRMYGDATPDWLWKLLGEMLTISHRERPTASVLLAKYFPDKPLPRFDLNLLHTPMSNKTLDRLKLQARAIVEAWEKVKEADLPKLGQFNIHMMNRVFIQAANYANRVEKHFGKEIDDKLYESIIRFFWESEAGIVERCGFAPIRCDNLERSNFFRATIRRVDENLFAF